MLKKTIVTIGFFFILVSSAYTQGNGSDQFNDYLMNLPYQELSEIELQGLIQMREEEKLARDVYQELYDQWGIVIFNNIAKSEQSHTDMVALLFQKYNLQDPFIDQRGAFTDTAIQQLYQTLITLGSESQAKAFFVGCTIEDLDIYDLEDFIAQSDNEDIQTVYQNLMQGSRNHMRSFYRQYSNLGETYTAQYISATELDQILNSEMEKGFVDANGETIVFNEVNQDSLFYAYLLDLPQEELNETEVTSLVQMREEEKLARDVYLELFELWDYTIFNNIAKSEQSHTEMVALMFQKYNLQDPYIDQRGVFSDTTIQNLFDALIATGSESLEKALFVGCTIEDLDIYDLEEFLLGTDNIDIRTVYQNLMKGSRNHMRSFSSLYSMQGLTYEAQFIVADELAQILNSEFEKGFVDENGNPFTLTSVNDFEYSIEKAPSSYIVAKNYPNPFNPQTIIQFTLPNTAKISLVIFDINGRLVRTLSRGTVFDAGVHSIVWDGRNEQGNVVSSGLFFYRIENGAEQVTKQMIFLK